MLWRCCSSIYMAAGLISQEYFGAFGCCPSGCWYTVRVFFLPFWTACSCLPALRIWRNSFTSLVLPRYEHVVYPWPLQLAEVLFILWLLIKGVESKPLSSPATAAAAD